MIRWATFDCLGTLVDWRHGIRASAELLCPDRGAEVLERYIAHQRRSDASA
jgi:2-haloacid dehalogenase